MEKKPFPFSVCKECCAESGGGSGETITIDTEMSDTSENTVQNKVIKKYVDDKTDDIETALDNIIVIQNELIGGETV